MIYYRCQNCDEVISSQPEKAGVNDMCPNCGFANAVPSPAGVVRELSKKDEKPNKPLWFEEKPSRKKHFLLPEREVSHYCRCGAPMVRLHGRGVLRYVIVVILAAGGLLIRKYLARIPSLWLILIVGVILCLGLFLHEITSEKVWRCTKCRSLYYRRDTDISWTVNYCIRLLIFVLFIFFIWYTEF